MGVETRVFVYKSDVQMKQHMVAMQRAGWTVAATQAIDPGWGCLKTAILGCLFLPLALLGKKPRQWQVTYQRQMP